MCLQAIDLQEQQNFYLQNEIQSKPSDLQTREVLSGNWGTKSCYCEEIELFSQWR